MTREKHHPVVRIDREREWRLMDEKLARLIPEPEEAARVFRGVSRIASRHAQRDPNWVIAMELYGTGSTYAYAICRRIGIDPDAKLGDLR